MKRLEQLQRRHDALVEENQGLLADLETNDGKVHPMKQEDRDVFEGNLQEMKDIRQDIQNLRDQEAAEARATEGTGREVITDPDGRSEETPVEEASPFDNIADFVRYARFGPRNEEQRAFSMDVGAEGGVNVPTQFLPEIMQFSPEEAIVEPRANVIPPGDPPDSELTFPRLKQGADGVYGGVTFSWLAEGGDKPETGAAFQEGTLKPEEVAGHVVVADKLLRNWEAAQTFITGLLRKGLMGVREQVFLSGDGVGKPKGALNADCKLAQVRDGELPAASASLELDETHPPPFDVRRGHAQHRLVEALARQCVNQPPFRRDSVALEDAVGAVAERHEQRLGRQAWPVCVEM
ncbi:MAG: phage major capsid protein [Armatimonadota bacterium]